MNGAVSTAARAATLPIYRAGAVPTDSDVVIFLAQSMGYFSRRGFDVTIQAPGSSGDATTAAIVGGSLDFGTINTLSLAVAYQNGVPVKIIAPDAQYTTKAPSTQMLVPRDSTASVAKDLNGKTIAVNALKGVAHVSAQAWIDRNGGDYTSVRFIEMPFSLMPTALTAHHVDAAVIAEPALTVAKKDSRVFANSYDGIGPNWMIGGCIASEDWIRTHPGVPHAFASAIHDAATWANKHHAETVPMVSAISKVPPDIVAASTRSTFAETMDLSLIQPVIDVAAKYGVLKSSFPAAELVYSS